MREPNLLYPTLHPTPHGMQRPTLVVTAAAQRQPCARCSWAELQCMRAEEGCVGSTSPPTPFPPYRIGATNGPGPPFRGPTPKSPKVTRPKAPWAPGRWSLPVLGIPVMGVGISSSRRLFPPLLIEMMVMGLSVTLTLWGAGTPTLHPSIHPSIHLIDLKEALGVGAFVVSRCAELDSGIVPWHSHSLAVPSSWVVEGFWPRPGECCRGREPGRREQRKTRRAVV
ncbi:hypothetical protein B0T18DRAFT_238328 [Schizothecium vesticola]|uniref:Uncharacterized protein n=1 Tax=Schizothecium vesticola TaxID=314040 RepID=A0AA40BPT5_9PEZI|nr:hypothetical protein B0T18DRAFT_238328 [Schizothecium vesticola]